MRVPRVFTQQPLTNQGSIRLDEAALHHLLDVLRLRPGSEIRLFNGDGREYAGRIIETSRSSVRVMVGEITRRDPPPILRFHLLLGMSRGDRMDYAVQKAVELGVDRIAPLFTERSQVKLDAERAKRRLEHWRKIAVYASEQSGRCHLPGLAEPRRLEEVLAAGGDGAAFLLDHRSKTTLEQISRPTGELRLLIGPEGGLSPRERELARSEGFKPVRLGPRVLRTETAPLVALAAMQMLWGDFRSDLE